MKKRTNPLTRRIPRELAGDWRKYLVVFLFLVLTIGFVSGMYVANESMMRASVDGVTTYKLEYGHFELSRAADDTLLAAIETGNKADVRQFYTDKARRELDEKFPGEFRGQFDSEFHTKFDAEFQNQVKQTLLAGGLDADTAAAEIDIMKGVVTEGTGGKAEKAFYNVSIADEKEVILIVSRSEQKSDIMRAIIENAGPGTAAGAIVFSLPVSEAAGFGMFEDTSGEEE